MIELWRAINRYAVACGGDPSKNIYGNTARQKAVARIEAAVNEMNEGYPGVVHDFEQAKSDRDELWECCREMLDMIERLPSMGKLSPCDGRVRWRKVLGRDPKTGERT